MPRKYDDFDDGFEVRRREPDEEPVPFREERRPVRRRRTEEPETKKAPLLIRIIAWLAVVAFCFVDGHVGTSFALRLPNKNDILMPQAVVSDRQEAQGVLEDGSAEIRVNARKVAFTVYFPREEAIASEKTDILSGIMEDDIRQIFGKILSLVPGSFSPDMKVLNVFRSGDTLFLNLNAPFISSLSKLGVKESTLFITAVVRTITENFPPLTKVRFLVNGKVTREGTPVDLTVPWQLPQ